MHFLSVRSWFMAMNHNLIHIDVVYALPEKQHVEHLQLRAGISAREAIKKSSLPKICSGIDVDFCPLGVFGQQVADQHILKSGDRLEVYRPLINDPRDTRRRLAAEGKTMGSSKKSGSSQ
jgi:uncharacterized protein